MSAYALTVEPATPLGRRVAAGAAAPDDDVQADAYLLADELLGAAGLEWYEVSNWARPGEECRHNLLYWSEGEYLGIGCAAHGHTDGRRWWNVRTPERYIAAIAAGTPAEAGRGAARARAPGRGGVRAGAAHPVRGRRWRRGRGERGRGARRPPDSCAGSTIGSCSPLRAGSSRPM